LENQASRLNNKLKIILKILMEGIVTLLLVTFLSFLLMRLAPIDQAEAYARRNTVQPSPDKIQEIRIQMGLDKPLAKQYITWLERAIHLDFGNSLTNNKPVIDDLVFASRISIKIILISVFLQIPLGILIGSLEYSFLFLLFILQVFILTFLQ
jgi:peptide/nickel transport system permease protein